MKFQSIKTSKLKIEQIKEILQLKNSFWKYGYKSQSSWFKKKILPNDLHNVMLINNKILGYTLLGNRTYYLKGIKKKYMLFSTLIIKKKYRNYHYVSKMMKFNCKTILKHKKVSFLICKKNKLKFYKFFGWIFVKKSFFIIPDHKSNYYRMIYNYKKKKLINKIIHKFYYNS